MGVINSVFKNVTQEILSGYDVDFLNRKVQCLKMLVDFPVEDLGLEHRRLSCSGTILEASKELPSPLTYNP